VDNSTASAANAQEGEDGHGGLHPPRQVSPPLHPRTAFFAVILCHEEAYS
jgi:hypothetical protein